jgi:hypothetical protein
MPWLFLINPARVMIFAANAKTVSMTLVNRQSIFESTAKA